MVMIDPALYFFPGKSRFDHLKNMERIAGNGTRSGARLPAKVHGQGPSGPSHAQNGHDDPTPAYCFALGNSQRAE